MGARSSVFISYASEYAKLADSIALAIREDDFEVFLDRDHLQAGGAFHKQIHDQIGRCDVFVFLLSSEAIAEDRYTMTELAFARKKWPHPKGRVLTVPVGQSYNGVIPPYLTATTFVPTTGNIPANVRAAVARLIADQKRTTRLGNTLGTFLKIGVGKSAAYANTDNLVNVLKQKMEDGGGRIHVGDLKDALDEHDEIPAPQWVSVEGVFFPGALMCSGWWQRSNKNLMKMKWNDPSWQSWLFSGFEQWAPSWDINDWSDRNPFRMVAQIGARDEADSIPVLVKSARKAKRIREDLEDTIVLNAYVRGLLCHESRFPELAELTENDREFFNLIKTMTDSQYYLIVFDGDDARNGIEFLRRKVDFYSGYLWQCWSPKEWTPADPFQTKLPGAYFVWEHSNLADRDVVCFGLDTLEAKKGFLRRRLQSKDLSGELVLLQHLMQTQRLCDDRHHELEPAIPTEQFTNLFLADEPAEAAS
jgi:hypothetical protein